jgi:hypothetical protein
MKKVSLSLGVLLMAVLVYGQSEQYYQKMGETLQLFASINSVDDYQDLANKFRVIGNVEKEEWLPLYYEAHCYILMSFMDQEGAEVRDGYLQSASGIVDKMTELAPDEAEVAVMTAFYHTGYLVVNPPQRAMSTTPLIHAAIGRALAIEPENPRAIFLRISNEMGTASFFGEDTTPYCEQANQLLKDWDNYELRSPIHPNWGKDDIEGIVRGCKQKSGENL